MIKKFSELKNQMLLITDKMLSIQLKQLEEDGLIKRKVYTSKPFESGIFINRIGKSLLLLLNEIAKWGRNRE